MLLIPLTIAAVSAYLGEECVLGSIVQIRYLLLILDLNGHGSLLVEEEMGD